MTQAGVRIVVLGASGLIGQAVAEGLARSGAEVTAIARHFTAAQAAAFLNRDSCPIVDLDTKALAGLLAKHRPDIVLNCVGVLQDTRRGTTRDVHVAFVRRLLAAMAAHDHPLLLIHVSIPGRAADDETPFSRSKREAEGLISDARTPFVVLRPGFVIVPGAYGGSALIRGLALAPVRLPDAVTRRPLVTTSIDDLADTVLRVVARWVSGERDWRAVWDVVAEEPTTVASVIEAFRRRFGGPEPVVTLPVWMLNVGALAGDAAAGLGWSPPIRTNALREMMRGVEGDPGPWMAASGITPTRLAQTVAGLPSTVQEQWFGRMYLLKPLIVAGLAGFWTVSGLVALLVSFEPATAILVRHGIPHDLGRMITVVTSLADIAIGVAVAVRASCRIGLVAGITVALFYMIGAVLIAPDLWAEPLGALVKTGPAIVLMVVALAVLDAR